ncbi:MAG: hypothetical protein RLZZ416_322 [Candidatus Parcubacteria bacterium]|jgi:hypothetical protein
MDGSIVRMVEKKSVLITSAMVSAAFIVWDYMGNYRLCDYLAKDGHMGSCPFLLSSTELILIPFFPFFFFSLITYFMREDVFRAWVRFAIPAVIVSMILILLTPDSPAGGFGPQIALGKSDTALVASVLFSLISLILIVVKLIRTK